MAPLAVLAIVAGVLGIPGVTDMLEKFLEPTFADSRFADTAPTTGAEVSGLVVGGILALAGIAAAYFVFVRNPAIRARTIERFAGVHRFLFNKWYFDELFDAVVRAPRRHDRAASAARWWRARSCRGSWWAAPWAWCARAPRSRARSRRVSCAPTPCC